MKKSPVIIAVIAFSVIGMVWSQSWAELRKAVGTDTSESMEKITKTFPIAPFSKIEMDQNFQVNYTQGPTKDITVSCPGYMEEYLNIKVKEGTLKLTLVSGWRVAVKEKMLNIQNPNREGVEVTVSSPNLTEVESWGACQLRILNDFASRQPLKVELSGASAVNAKNMSIASLEAEGCGASSIKVGDIKCGNFDLELSGASSASFGNLVCEKTDVELTGASSVKVASGSCPSLDLELHGASFAGMENFAVKSAEVELTGGSSAKANVSGLLDIDSSGASSFKNYAR